jgi:hypothetical protein
MYCTTSGWDILSHRARATWHSGFSKLRIVLFISSKKQQRQPAIVAVVSERPVLQAYATSLIFLAHDQQKANAEYRDLKPSAYAQLQHSFMYPSPRWHSQQIS